MSRGILIADKKIVGSIALPDGTRDGSSPRPKVPGDTVPWHLRPREDGLAVTDEASLSRRRFSPLRSWPEVVEIDRRVRELEQRTVTISDELRALQEQHTQTVERDRQRLADWVQDGAGERPLPEAPKLEDRIEQLEAERAAVDVAIRDVLAEKVRLVTKIRGRLVRDARKRRMQAIATLERLIADAEQARDEATAYAASEQWARDYPDEVSEDLRLQLSKGGRVPQSIPELRTLTAAVQLFSWLREDCAWLSSVLADKPGDDAPDLQRVAVWEATDEGQAALERERQRQIENITPRNVRAAGWE